MVHNFAPVLDMFGEKIDLWDCILAVSAGGQLELCLVTGLTIVNNQYIPKIQRFNSDLTLRERQTEYFHCSSQAFVLESRSIPEKAWELRCLLQSRSTYVG